MVDGSICSPLMRETLHVVAAQGNGLIDRFAFRLPLPKDWGPREAE